MDVFGDSQILPKDDFRSVTTTNADDSCASSKVWFVFLDFHHQMMEVYELRAHRQTAEGGLGEDLMETVIVLDELGQCSLENTTRKPFVGSTAHS